ncbi:MAG: hypothetical protein ACI9KN_000041 [Gammaproteobacteria bacterium]
MFYLWESGGDPVDNLGVNIGVESTEGRISMLSVSQQSLQMALQLTLLVSLS